MTLLKNLLTCIILLSISILVKSQTTDTISQYGITWTFSNPVQYGQYASGDYWVLGPVSVISIDPVSTNISGRIKNGSMLNPSPVDGTTQGYDSHMYTYGGTYSPDFDSTLDVALDVSVSNPLNITTGSLVSSISFPEEGPRPQSEVMAILTVVPSIPDEGSFRPAYCGTDKTSTFNVSTLEQNASLLEMLDPVEETPEISEVQEIFTCPWVDHIPNWQGDEHFHHSRMPNFSRELGTAVGNASLLLHLDLAGNGDITENYNLKKDLLISLVQIGIDNMGVVKDGGNRNWIPNGGHATGRLWPIIFAGLMLNDNNVSTTEDNELREIGNQTGSYLFEAGGSPGNIPDDYVCFGETGQTFYVSQTEIDATHASNWEPDTRACPAVPYTSADINRPEWGIEHINRPRRDNNHWQSIYRVDNGVAWGGYILAMHIMEATGLANHPPLIDYMDHYMAVMKVIEDGRNETGVPYTYPEDEYAGSLYGGIVYDTYASFRAQNSFIKNMWDTYRDNYDEVYNYDDSPVNTSDEINQVPGHLFPNPVHFLSELKTNTEENLIIKVYTVTGIFIGEYIYGESPPSLKQGVYILEIKNENSYNSIQEKIIIY